MRAVRFETNPLIRVGDAGVGDNVNGASVVRVPEWAGGRRGRLGNYYLYFAHHAGAWIRMAYADRVEGPWRVHEGGVMRLEESAFREVKDRGHVASPDVHVDEGRKKLVMFYHGGYLAEVFRDGEAVRGVGGARGEMSEYEKLMYRQATAVAESEDGVRWRALAGLVGLPYWRRFEWGGRFYAVAMPGVFYQGSVVSGQWSAGDEGVNGFRRLDLELFTPRMRHAAVVVEGDILKVFYTNAGDCPERILVARVALDKDWRKWRVVGREDLLLPEMGYEGGELQVEASRRGAVDGRVRQLRDPCVFEEGGRRYLFYAGAGEQVICGAELI